MCMHMGRGERERGEPRDEDGLRMENIKIHEVGRKHSIVESKTEHRTPRALPGSNDIFRYFKMMVISILSKHD